MGVVVVMMAVHRGLNPRKTLVDLGSLRSGKRLGAGERRERVKRHEERVVERRVLAVPPMAFRGSIFCVCGDPCISCRLAAAQRCWFSAK